MITIREKTIDELANEIEAKYKPQKEVFLNLLLVALASDGPSQESKVTLYQNMYNQKANQENIELEALYNE